MTDPVVSTRPNIVLIVADDLGWGDLGCYGATQIPTPHVDAVAAAGTRFTDCHAASAVCTPSRYALLTGRYAWRTPLKRRVLGGFAPSILEPDRPTVAGVLSSAGYRTAAVGKWHLGLGWRRQDGTVRNAFDPGAGQDDVRCVGDFGDDVDLSQPFTDGPTAHGFDDFFGVAGSLDMPPYAFLRGAALASPVTGPKTQRHRPQRPGPQSADWDDFTVDQRFGDEAVNFLDHQGADHPFFLYVASSAPHRPCLPPASAAGRSSAGRRGDMVCVFDDLVGRIDEALSRHGFSDNTLLLITSDNGAEPGDVADNGDIATYGHRANGSWRGQKADIWEAGHRVPLIARWPGRIPAGAVADGLIGLIDLLPTLASAIGADLPPDAAPDAVDQHELLVGGATRRRSSIHHSGRGWFAIRRDNWKAIFGTGSGGFSEPPGAAASAAAPDGQLYDLGTDPGETTNQWSPNDTRVAALYRELQEHCGPDAGLPADLRLGPGSATASP